MNCNVTINEVLLAIAVFAIIATIGLLLIQHWARVEKRRIEKEYHDRWPSAREKINGISQKDLDRLMDYDDSETFYHK